MFSHGTVQLSEVCFSLWESKVQQPASHFLLVFKLVLESGKYILWIVVLHSPWGVLEVISLKWKLSVKWWSSPLPPFPVRKSSHDKINKTVGKAACSVQQKLVSWCFKLSQPQRITSGLNTNFSLSPSYSFRKPFFLSLKQQLKFYPQFRNANQKNKHMFWSLFIFREHSTRERASSRVTFFILRTYTGTSVSHSQHRKKSEEVLEKMQVNGPEE